MKIPKIRTGLQVKLWSYVSCSLELWRVASVRRGSVTLVRAFPAEGSPNFPQFVCRELVLNALKTETR